MSIYSKVNVCNLALGRVGASRVSAVPENTQEGRECDAIFDLMRDEVLGRFPWTFASKRCQLAQSSTAPAYGYEYAYVLPADFIRLLEIKDQRVEYTIDNDTTVVSVEHKTYVIENNLLLTNEDEVYILYTYRNTDPSKWSSMFVNALSFRLAAELAMSIAKDKDLAAHMREQYRAVFLSAAADSANQDNTERDTYTMNSYVIHRTLGGN